MKITFLPTREGEEMRIALPNNREASVVSLTYGRGRITEGPRDAEWNDNQW